MFYVFPNIFEDMDTLADISLISKMALLPWDSRPHPVATQSVWLKSLLSTLLSGKQMTFTFSVNSKSSFKWRRPKSLRTVDWS